MDIENKNIGFVITGSFCTFANTIPCIEELVNLGSNVIPIMSNNAYSLDTKFGNAKTHIERIENITKNKIIHTIQDAEPIGPKHMTDIMVIAPCTGNTIAKLANGFTDNAATMAVKSHLRNNKPVVIGISTNDGLSGSAENIGKLLNRRNYYFVPFAQDNPITKPTSIVFKPNYLIETIKKALDNTQIQPILI